MPKVGGRFAEGCGETHQGQGGEMCEKCRSGQIKCGKDEIAPEIMGDFHKICQKRENTIQKNLTEPERWCHTLGI